MTTHVVRIERRTTVLVFVMVALMLGLSLLGLCYGASWASPGKVLAVLTGAEHSVVILSLIHKETAVLSGTSAQLATGSVVGGLLVAAAIYLLSFERGFSGLRLVVIGIAVNAMVTAINSWIVLRAELEVAIAAVGWSAGSLNGVGWADLGIPFTVIAVLLVLITTRAHAVHQAALGDAIATTTGVGLNRLRLLMVLVGVGCTATVTAVAGPIA